MAKERKMVNNMTYERIYSKRQIIIGIVTGKLKPGTEKCPDCLGEGEDRNGKSCVKCSSSGMTNVPRWNTLGDLTFYSMYMDLEKEINQVFELFDYYLEQYQKATKNK